MGFLTETYWIDLLVFVIFILLVIYFILNINYGYWDKRGVPNLKKGGLIMNQITGKQTQSETVKEWYNQFQGEKYFGFIQLTKPMLMVRDLDLINQIMVKDFNHFQDRGQPENKNDPITNNLFGMRGQMWREMRYKLTPTFTTGKLKGMFDQVTQCGGNMISRIDEQISKESPELNCKDFLFEYTADVIASCAFGIQFEPNSPEFNDFKSIVQSVFQPSAWSLVKILVGFTFPKLAESLNIRPFMAKRNVDYFKGLISEAAKYRKENNLKRNDYLQLLLTLKEQEDKGELSHSMLMTNDTTEDDEVILEQMKYSGDHEKPLATNVKLFTDDTVCANSVIFLIAGSESTSSSISLTLYQLALHLDIQQRLQKEIDTVLSNHKGQWSYQAMKEMTYLDQVVQESQRMYPIIPLLQRECTKTYKVPDSDLVIEKGVIVTIPVAGLHLDPQHYPDPETFNPDRFEGNNFKPNPAFLPFGDGPRICIAMRFAVMEVKVSVARIMANFTVTMSPKTHVPLKLDPRSFVPLPKGGMWLKFEKRQKA
ncbi:cytochrome P450 6a2-like [Macrosteles quadrilineatus]|uniref:cytochrome P450 6a2-like n=1 Tax=Macrosteles quadrilineatus TaxID=74068 RepID=UPI0023E30F08|nr:cytochrome P450 6a2-like [Macrosteles quadrilineatus]